MSGYRCELLLRALFPDYASKKSQLERVKSQLKKNHFASFTLSDGFVTADKIITVRRHEHGSSTSIVIVCPRCGELGILKLRRRRAVANYLIKHPYHTCTFSRSSDGYDWLDRIYRQVRQEWRL